MINAQMRLYDYFTIGEDDGYGQPQISTEPEGTIKLAINVASQNVQDDIKYKDCTYIGLTQAKVNDTYVIKYGAELLKVLYVNSLGRYQQVFMKEM